MKKLISVILALFVMLVPMAGCTKDNEDSTSLTLSQNMINISLFGRADIIASYNNVDELTWSNDNSSVISMTAKGNYVEVMAISAGMARVTATGGGKSATCIVVVAESDYALAVDIDRVGDIELVANGTTYLPAKATYMGEALLGAKLNYKMADETIATISNDGVITGLKGGSTKLEIVAEYEGTYSAPVYVNVSVKSGPVLVLNATYFNMYEHDKTVSQKFYPSSVDFYAYIVDGGKEYKDIDLVIDNTNDDVAIIEDGYVKSVGVGETVFTITCTYNEQIYTAQLYVYVDPIPTVEIILSETDISLYADPIDPAVYTTMMTINPTIRINGNAVAGDIEWAVDEGEGVAVVTNKGVVKSVSAGKAVVSANFKYNGKLYKNTCKVTIIEDLFYGALKTDVIDTNMAYAYLSSSYPTLKIEDVDLTTSHDVDLIRFGVPNINGDVSKIYRVFIRATDVNDPTNWVEFVYSHYNNGSTLGVNAYAMNASTWNIKGLAGIGEKSGSVEIMGSTTSATYCGAGSNAGKAGVYYGDLAMKFKQALGANYERQLMGFSIVDDEINCNYVLSNDTRTSRAVFTKASQATLLAEGTTYENPVWDGFTAKGVSKVDITIKAQLSGTSPIIIDTVSGSAVDANIISRMSLVKA